MARKIEVQIVGDSSNLSRALKDATGHTSRFGGALGMMATRAAAAAGAAGIGALVGGLALSAKAAVDFERQMRNVNSIAGLGEDSFKALGKSVTGMAAEVGQKPKVLAAGLYSIVSSGFKAADAVKVLRVSAKAATAGLTSTATASKAVTAALNAYHLGADSARKVSDVLFQTVNKGVLTFEELSEQMGDLVPIAAPLGVQLEEVGAAMSTLTLQGVPAAEAATRVKNVMVQLAKPSKELAGLLKEQGFASGEAAVKQLGLAGVLEMLSKATGGSVTETAKLTPEIRSLMGVVGLTGRNLATYNEHLAAMKSAQEGAGVTAGVFAEQSRSVAVMWQKASAAIDVFKVQIGTALLPALSSALTALSAFFVQLNAAEGFTAKLKVVWEGVSEVAVDLWAQIKVAWEGQDKVIRLDGKQLIEVEHVEGIKEKLRAALAAIDWSDLLVTVGVGLAKGVAQLQRAIWENIARAWLAAWGMILSTVRDSAGQLAGAVRSGIANLPGAISSVAGRAVQAAVNLGARIVAGVISGLAGLLKSVRGKLGEIITAISNTATNAFSAAVSIGWSIVRGVLSGLGGIGQSIKNKIDEGLSWALSKIDVRGGSPPESAGAHLIGEPLGRGVIRGWITSTASLPSTMSDSLRKAIERARDEVEKARDILGAAFDNMTSRILRAFDAQTTGHKTATEQLLAEQDERRTMEDLIQRQADAQVRLNEAIASGEAAAISAAQREVMRAGEDIARVGLEKQAEQERKDFESSREELRIHLEKRLEQLGEHWKKVGVKSQAALNQLNALLLKVGLTSFSDSGKQIGAAFVAALQQEISTAASAAAGVGRAAAGGRAAPPVVSAAAAVGAAAPITVVFPNYVGDKDDLMATVRSGLAQISNRGGLGIG